MSNIETIIVETHGDILSENDKKELYDILHSKGNIISLTDGASLSEEEFLNIDGNPNIKWINE